MEYLSGLLIRPKELHIGDLFLMGKLQVLQIKEHGYYCRYFQAKQNKVRLDNTKCGIRT